MNKPFLFVEMSERIRFAVDSAGGDKFVGANSGVKIRSIQNYKSGKAVPSAETIGRISKATGFSLGWLVFGEGPMHFTDRALVERIVREAIADGAFDEALRKRLQEIADPECGSDAEAKEAAIKLLSQQISGLPLNQIMAVTVFALCLQIGAVQVGFFKLIADVLEDPAGEQ